MRPQDLEVRCICGWHTVAGARKVRALEVPDSQPVVSIGAVPKHPRPPGHPRHPRCIAVCRVVLYVIRVVGTLSELQRLASVHKVLIRKRIRSAACQVGHVMEQYILGQIAWNGSDA